MDRKTKITVAGIGGVGGYLSAMLARRYEHVTLVARGERKKALEEQGIHMNSEFHGEITAKPWKIVEKAQEIQEKQDLVFICVKTYSLEEICKDLQECIDEHTVILPVMNGADTAERARKFLGRGHVLDAVIYITAFSNPDYSVTQIGRYAKIQIGKKEPSQEEKQALEEAWTCMKEAGMDVHISQDVEAAVWEKYIFNCGYNVLTTYYMEMVEDLQASPEKCREFRQLMEEAYAVSQAKKIQVRDGYIESEYQRFLRLDAGSTSSLKRDREAGKRDELETFSGYLVSEAKKLGVPVPLTERMYEKLRRQPGL